LAYEACAAHRRRLDRVERTLLPLFGRIAAEPVEITLDHHQQVIEIVRNPAGEMTDRLKALGLLEGSLRHLAPLHLHMKAPSSLKGIKAYAKEQQGRRNTKAEKTAHA
jgi:hypothetical protein